MEIMHHHLTTDQHITDYEAIIKTLQYYTLMNAFPDVDNTVKQAELEESKNTVTCLVTIIGTQEKEFAGIPSKGNRFESDHIFIFRFNEAEKIDKINIRWDHERFVEQLTA